MINPPPDKNERSGCRDWIFPALVLLVLILVQVAFVLLLKRLDWRDHSP